MDSAIKHNLLNSFGIALMNEKFAVLFVTVLLVLLAAVSGHAAGMAAAGAGHSVLVKSDGTLWSWGSNEFGQLGIGAEGDSFSSSHSQQVGTDSDWQAVEAGAHHTVALKTDGSLWAWGGNEFGQLGIGAEGGPFSSPQQVGADSDWQAVEAGTHHTVALKTDGTLWTWGKNTYSQLGSGTPGGSRKVPAQVGADKDWQAVAAGGNHTMAIKKDGSLWAWGWNDKFQLGDGTRADHYSPKQVDADKNWQAVAAGARYTVALKNDGSLWFWGDNGVIQKIPVQLGVDKKWDLVAAGGSHAAAVRSDGTLWTWGDNKYGQLGDGTAERRDSPVQVGTAANWQEVAAGTYHVAAVQKDDTLWTWGYNKYGQLGDGTTEQKNQSAQISIARQYIGNGTVYIDHGNGTITDKKTGLMWKRCSEGLSGVNCEKGETEEYTWNDAVQRFKNVAYAGSSDWRLPTIDELKTLVSCSKGQNEHDSCNDGSETPMINQQAFPNTVWSYWSGSPYADSSDYAWLVVFGYGYSSYGYRGNSYAVRLVRGGQ
jgi:alpha-tubulin suppressor-like RCC1 family protein